MGTQKAGKRGLEGFGMGGTAWGEPELETLGMLEGGRDAGGAALGAQGTDGLSMDNASSSGLFKGTAQMQLPSLGKSCFPGIAMDKRDGSSWQPFPRRSHQLRQLWWEISQEYSRIMALELEG